MSRNANKQKCRHPGCRAWAKRDGGGLCASHAKQTRVGAPKGNQNAIKHGFYAAFAQVPAVNVVPTLEQEILLLASRRDAVDRWYMAMMEAGQEVDVLKYLELIGEIGSRISRMIKLMGPEGGGDTLEELFFEALDRLSESIEVKI